MPDSAKVVINLATGLEDAERVTVAFLVGDPAVERGRKVAMFLTKEAVPLGLPGYADGVACDGCPPLSRLFHQFADGGASSLFARSASALANSTKAAWWPTRASRGRRRFGSGLAMSTQRSSATDPGAGLIAALAERDFGRLAGTLTPGCACAR